MHPKHLKIADYSYNLPEIKIAKYPLEARDDSKLLVYKNGHISETVFNQLVNVLPDNSLLVFNNSKVIEARLLFKKESGGTIEIFVLEPYKMDVTTAMQTTTCIECLCLVGGAKKWKSGKLALLVDDHILGQGEILLEAELVKKVAEAYLISFSWQPTQSTFADILHIVGQIPIPPYLERQADAADTERYQTIYAEADGSVAAPTAGLHFTPAVMESLKEKQIATVYTTLHVGAGTFKPVKSETIEGHDMHAEYMNIDVALIKDLMKYEKIISVGTTSMRTIESIYWMGLKTFLNPAILMADLEIKQWEIYDGLMLNTIAKSDVLQALLNWMEVNGLPQLIITTKILIAPGYSPKIATGIVTNFHQPNSTLLLLIAALVGQDWKKIYNYALEHEFRFLSYGDSSYIEKKLA